MSLTASQTAMHWRNWSAVSAANDWGMERSRLSALSPKTSDLSIYHKLVWKAAAALALQAHRAVTADDLRHACYLTATTNVPGWGQSRRPVASLGELDNRSFSRVLVLFKLLIEPDDIAAIMDWDHPENDDRERLLWSIKRSARGDAYIGAISAYIYGTRLWQVLDVAQLRNLNHILWKRQKKQDQPVSVSGIEEPY